MTKYKDGIIVQHKRGGRYKILAHAICVETEKEFVSYKSLDSEIVWCRESSDFYEPGRFTPVPGDIEKLVRLNEQKEVTMGGEPAPQNDYQRSQEIRAEIEELRRRAAARDSELHVSASQEVTDRTLRYRQDHAYILISALEGQIQNYTTYGTKVGMTQDAIKEHVAICTRLLSQIRRP